MAKEIAALVKLQIEGGRDPEHGDDLDQHQGGQSGDRPDAGGIGEN